MVTSQSCFVPSACDRIAGMSRYLSGINLQLVRPNVNDLTGDGGRDQHRQGEMISGLNPSIQHRLDPFANNSEWPLFDVLR
jgi:hypothetical protein